MAEGPFRNYTELSARTLACYLASLDNAEDGLCRNPPRLPSDFPPADGVRRPKRRSAALHTRESAAESTHRCSETTRKGIEDVSGRQVPPQSGNLTSRTEDTGTQEAQDFSSAGITREVKGQHGDVPGRDSPAAQKMKDPKSFTQNLFDTLSLRMVEWLPLRRSPDSFDSDPDHSGRGPSPRRSNQETPTETPHGQKRRATHRPHLNGDKAAISNGVIGNGFQTPSSRHTGSQPAAVELKLPGQQVKRLSLTDMEHWRQTPRSSMEEKTRQDRKSAGKLALNTPSSTNAYVGPPSPPALKHRPQKHRGINGDLNGVYFAEEKKHRRVSWDGSKLLKESHRYETQSQDLDVRDQSTTTPLAADRRQGKRKGKRRKGETTASIETIAHLSNKIIDGLCQMILESDEDAQKWKEEIADMELRGSFDDSEWHYATPAQRQAFPFVAQSVFYVLSSTKHILRSFRREPTSNKDGESRTTNSRLDMQQVEPSLRRLFTICPWDIALHSLWSALERLFVPPKELSTPTRSPHNGSVSGTPAPAPIIPSRSPAVSDEEPVSDTEAAEIATVVLFALISSLPKLDIQTWKSILQMRAAGTVMPDADMRKLPRESRSLVADTTDRFEHELALRLVGRLVRALTARLAFYEISKARQIYAPDTPKQRKTSVLDLVLDNLREHHSLTVGKTKDLDSPLQTSRSPSACALIVEWLRTLFLKEWDGKPEMAKCSAAGGAVQILASMYRDRNRLGLEPEDFHTAFLSERLDAMEMPVQWLGTLSNNRTMHLLSYPFLFPPSALVIYFRALNYATMSKSYEAAMTATRHVTQTAFGTIPVPDEVGLLGRLRTSMSTYLVLVVRRDNVLTDALNQLWRREKRELLRPLKVQMGMDEGEEGVDHGGVQQEFFRVVMAEALSPAFGMFTTDSRTRISWFQPCSLEPLYKFELLGLLISLAVYNGLTLPVNFPVALYGKLLGLKVKHLDHIRDGWPELAKGLEDLLTWEDGDVGDIFMRTYEFSFEAFGSIKTVDMERVGRDAPWPAPDPDGPRGQARSHLSDYSSSRSDRPGHGGRKSRISMLPKNEEPGRESFRTGILKGVGYNAPLATPSQPAPEASLVTNENRQQFVKDYIFWLTDKSIRPQYEAFARGFYTCLDRSALSIFTPEALKTVVEGIQEINIEELERHARYEGGFSASHRVVRDFWHIVKRFPQEKKRRLLEFVTASDRVPVNGIASIMFVIQKNGVGDTVSCIPFLSIFVRCQFTNDLAAPPDQPDVLWPAAASGVFLEGCAAGEAREGIGERAWIWSCLKVARHLGWSRSVSVGTGRLFWMAGISLSFRPFLSSREVVYLPRRHL